MSTPQRLATVCALTLALAACSPSEVAISEDNPYKEDFDLALQNATSEFEREVLKDGVITKAEYDEAMNRYVDCVRDHGISISSTDDYGMHTFAVSGDLDAYENEVEPLCSTGLTIHIAPMYYDITRDPQRRGILKVAAECLVRSGQVEAPFTGEDVFNLSTSETLDPLSQQVVTSEDFYRCLMNPLYDLTQD